MRRLAYTAIPLFLLALLFWPRPAAPPTEPGLPEAALSSPDESGTESDDDDDAVPDSATDVDEFLRETIPSTLPPPNDDLLRDLERAVDAIPGAAEVPRDAIEIRPELAPLPPSVADETEPEPDPDP